MSTTLVCSHGDLIKRTIRQGFATRWIFVRLNHHGIIPELRTLLFFFPAPEKFDVHVFLFSNLLYDPLQHVKKTQTVPLNSIVSLAWVLSSCAHTPLPDERQPRLGVRGVWMVWAASSGSAAHLLQCLGNASETESYFRNPGSLIMSDMSYNEGVGVTATSYRPVT